MFDCQPSNLIFWSREISPEVSEGKKANMSKSETKTLYRVRVAPALFGAKKFLMGGDYIQRLRGLTPVLEIVLDNEEDQEPEERARRLGKLVGFQVVEYFLDESKTPSILVSADDFGKLGTFVRSLRKEKAALQRPENEMSADRNYDEEMKGALLSVFANLVESGKMGVKPLTKENLDDDDSELYDFLNDLKSRVTP
jgi:hypothetical protein